MRQLGYYCLCSLLLVRRTIYVLGILLLAALMAIPPVTSQDTFAFTNQRLSHDINYAHHVEPTMVIAPDDTIFIGYKNSETHDGGGIRVSYTYSQDNGENWAAIQEMPMYWDPWSGQSDPWMVYFEDTLYYSYLEYDSTNKSQITMATTNDKGQTWNIVNATSNTGFADKETFTVGPDGTIYLVYDDVLENETLVRLSRSFDGGNSFLENVTMADSNAPNYVGPYILADRFTEGKLYASWTYIANFSDPDPGASDILFDSSTDFGNSWAIDRDISPASNGSAATYNFLSQRPAIVTLPVLEQDSTGRIYIVYEDLSGTDEYSNFDVWMQYSDDGGTTWSDKMQVNPESPYDQWMPDIELDSQDRLHMAYYTKGDSGSYNLEYRVYDPDSENFVNPITVTHEPTSSFFTRPGDYLSIRVDSEDKPHIVWSDGRENEMDVYYGHLISPYSGESTLTPSEPPDAVRTPLELVSTILALVMVQLIKLNRKTKK